MKKQFIFFDHLNSLDVLTVKTEKNNLIQRLTRSNLTDFQTTEAERIYVVLPDHMISIFELNLNTRNQSQLNKVARYAVEEKFPGRLEDYHIVSLSTGNNKASIRAVNHLRFKELIDLLSEYGISADEIIVESDMLNKNVCSMIFSEQEVSLSGGTLEQAYEFDRSVVPLVIEKIFSLLDGQNDLNIIHEKNEDLIFGSIENQAPESVRIKRIIKDERFYENLCTSKFTSINLLSGDYKSNKNDLEKTSFWKYPIYLAATGLIAITSGLYAQNFILAKKNIQQEEQLINRYKELFPQASRPKDAIDLSIKLNSKKNNSSSSSLNILPINTLEFLATTSTSAQALNLEFSAFTIDKNSAELVIVGDSIEKLNTFKNNIEKELSNLSVNMDSVISLDEKYQGKIRIK